MPSPGTPVREWPRVAIAVAILISVLGGCGGPAVPDSRLEAATLSLSIETCGSLATQLATAVIVRSEPGPVLALTVGHALERYESLEVTNASGEAEEAEVVFLDQAKDIGVIRLINRANSNDGLELRETETLGDARLVSYRSGVVQVQESTVLRRVATTLDDENPRESLQISGEIKPGDSGSPVVTSDGAVIGLVFASTSRQDGGWAVDAVEHLAALETLDPSATVAPACG